MVELVWCPLKQKLEEKLVCLDHWIMHYKISWTMDNDDTGLNCKKLQIHLLFFSIAFLHVCTYVINVTIVHIPN